MKTDHQIDLCRAFVESSSFWSEDIPQQKAEGPVITISQAAGARGNPIAAELVRQLCENSNIPRHLAGAGYLRYLHERYGNPGVFAAYNAGPGRYEDYLKGRKLLPLETIDYISKVNQWASLEMAQGGLGTIVERNMAAHSDLFMRSPIAQSIHHIGDDEEMKRDQEMNQKVADLSALAPSSQGLFVKISERLESVE